MFSDNASPFSQTLNYFRDLFHLFQGDDFRANNQKSDHYRPTIHRYLKASSCNSFTLESVGKSRVRFSMTGFGANIQKCDFIIIQDQASITTYKVENIDYYLDPPDLWMASLMKCSPSDKESCLLLT